MPGFHCGAHRPSLMGCLISVSTSWKVRNSLGSCGGPAISEARVRPSISRSSTFSENG